MNGVERMQTGVFVKRFTFDEKRAHAVKRRFAFLLAQFVKCFENGVVRAAWAVGVSEVSKFSRNRRGCFS